MRFSVRTMLILVAVIGATLGIMSKLFVEQPEVFYQVLMVLATIVPFLLAIGTLAWLGLRGDGRKAAMICASCSEDLRRAEPGGRPMCPDCGADLTQAGAIELVPDRNRRW